MTLRYGDRHPRGEPKPTCFARLSYYDPNEKECKRCSHEYECRDEIAAKRRGGSLPTKRRDHRDDSGAVRDMPVRRGPDERTHAGIILDGESPFERFAKDCVTGACRGFFEEGGDFFRHWRW